MQQSLMLLVASMAFNTVVALQTEADPPHECACMNWKTTYDSGLAHCGQGKEFYEVDTTKTPQKYRADTPEVQERMCQNFFTKLDFNDCVNINPGYDEGTWCYVDKTCSEHWGAHKLANVNASWKFCRRGDPAHYKTSRPGDKRLRDLKPEELYQLSKKYDLPFEDVAKMAYPGSRAGEGRQTVTLAEFSDNGVPVLPTHVAQYLKANSLTTSPFWFDTNKDGTLPNMIVEGSTLYKMDKKSEPQADHPGTWAGLECLVNC